MIGIYHNRDLDGFTSGAIIKLKYPDATLIGHDYGEPIPKLPDEEDIIMADVSFPMEDMKYISVRSNSFTWIDHHISSMKDFEKYIVVKPHYISAVLDTTIAACEGTWNHLFPDELMPEAVRLLGEYDTWRNQNEYRWENEILPFQFGIRMMCNSAESFPVEVFENYELVEEIIERGKIVLEYQRQVNALQCKKAAFEMDFHRYRAICLNGGGFNSDVFKSVYDEEKHDIMMMFQFNGKFWTISLYTTNDAIDCSEIAKARGGGGHKKTAGFQVDNIAAVFHNIKSK